MAVGAVSLGGAAPTQSLRARSPTFPSLLAPNINRYVQHARILHNTAFFVKALLMSEHSHSRTERTANLLGALSAELSDRLDRLLKEHPNQTDSAMAALNLIGGMPGIANIELSRALKLSHPATARLVAKLASEQLLEVRQAQDRRAVSLHLSDKGRIKVGALVERRTELLAGLVGTLSADEQTQLGGLLEKLLPKLVGQVHDAYYICRLCDSCACPVDQCPVENAERQLLGKG